MEDIVPVPEKPLGLYSAYLVANLVGLLVCVGVSAISCQCLQPGLPPDFVVQK